MNQAQKKAQILKNSRKVQNSQKSTGFSAKRFNPYAPSPNNLARMTLNRQTKTSRNRNQKRNDILIGYPHISSRKATIGGGIISLFSEVDKLLRKRGQEKNELDPKVLYKTHHIIQKMRNYAKNNNLWWDEPLGNISIDQEIVLEWWYKKKKITIYIGKNAIDFIKVWGADMDNEMEDGSLTLNEQSMIESLWNWLVN